MQTWRDAWILNVARGRCRPCGGPHEEDRAKAIRHARAAVSRGSDDATALAIAGLVVWFDAHDIPMAFDLFDRALAQQLECRRGVHERRGALATSGPAFT
jgi:hypothetical protein